jgi:hypothetical protein
MSGSTKGSPQQEIWARIAQVDAVSGLQKDGVCPTEAVCDDRKKQAARERWQNTDDGAYIK